MSNEYSSIVKEYLTYKKNIEPKLVLLYLHQTNIAEKEIDIFKSHFIAALATVDPNFPLYLWCYLFLLVTITLNLLPPLQIKPKLSAYELLKGTFDDNKISLTLPSYKSLVHKATAKRRI